MRQKRVDNLILAHFSSLFGVKILRFIDGICYFCS